MPIIKSSTANSTTPASSFESPSHTLYDSLYSVIEANPINSYIIFTQKMADTKKCLSRQQFATIFKVTVASLVVWAIMGYSILAGALITLTAYSVFVLDTQHFENKKKPSVDNVTTALWGHMKTFSATVIAAHALRSLPKNFS